MNSTHTLILAGLIALGAGCKHTERSISNSHYQEESDGFFVQAPPPKSYRGELSEFDVLGLERNAAVTEADIQRALGGGHRVRLRPGSTVMLVQSGSVHPDGPMLQELSHDFRVVPFTGVPNFQPTEKELGQNQYRTEPNTGSYALSLRYAAAQAGAESIVCYWGVLESESQQLETKSISWVPVVNWFVPDERQHLRIRLRLAVIDVASGSWTMVSPTPFEDRALSTGPRRGSSDQRQVEKLKERAYEAGAKELARLSTP